MYRSISKKTILFIAILVVMAQLIFSLAQNAGFSFAQTSEIPLAPSSLMLNGTPTFSSISIQWVDNAMNEDHFKIERKLTTATDWAGSWYNTLSGSNIILFTDNTVASGISYDYRVQACRSGYGCSDYSYLIGVTAGTSGGGGGSTSSIPAAPSSLSLYGSPMPGYISLNWVDNANNEDRYSVQRKLSSASWSGFVPDSGNSFLLSYANAISYTDTTVTAGMTYDYRVTACLTGVGCSDYAYLSGVASTAVESSPNPPTTVTASSTVGKITVSWPASGAKYSIYRSVNGGSYQIWYTNITNLYYDDLSVTTGSAYTYKVKGCNSDGVTCSTAETVSNTVTYSGGTVFCTGLNLTLNDGKTTYIIGESVHYTWTCSPGGSASNVSIWLYKPNGTSVNYNYGSGFTQSMGFSTSNLLPGTHILKACFDSACATVNASQTFVVSTGGGGTDTASPSIPANLVATKDDYNQVDLSWTASTDNIGVSGYEVWRSAAGTWSKIGQAPVPPYIDMTVLPSTPYYYKVIAYDAAGNKSSPSSQLFLNTPATGESSYSSSSSPSPSPASSTIPSLNAWIDTVPNTQVTEDTATIISGIKSAGATSTDSFPNLTFYILSTTGPTNYAIGVLSNLNYPEAGSQGKNWSGSLNTANLPNGSYYFYAKGYVNGITSGTEILSNFIAFKINNSTAPTPVPSNSTNPVITIGLGDSAPGDTVNGLSISGTRNLGASSTLPLTAVAFKFYSLASNSINSAYQPMAAKMDSSYKYWSVPFDSTKLPNGDYKVIAKGIYNNTAYEYTSNFSFNITNGSQLPAPSPSNFSNPSSFNSSPVSTNLPGSSAPFFDTESQFPMECREKNIFDPEKCKQLMMQIGMPEPCRIGGVKTPEECTKIMMMQSMPTECREANATTEEACNRVMFIKYGPKECSEAKIFDKDQCEKFLFEKNAPPECLSQGISTPEDCEKYMIGKYGNMNNMKPESFPEECQKSGATTAALCDKVMKDKYMPIDCKNQGITDAKQCDQYMNMKYMPKDCKDAGAVTKEECNKVMFNKFSPEPCKKAGIENENECRDFMFNLYAPRVVCDGLSDWDCRREIKENHLGNIVAKQENYKKMKEDISSLSGTSATVEKIKEKFGQGNKMMPLTDNGVVLKIVNAEEKMVLNKEETLVQTAPVIVTIDSDGDGMPDDTEKRIGTDPNSGDTDNDGVSDGEEIKNGYNPLGAGEMTEEAKANVSPVDWALVQDKVLGHPTVDGTETEELEVSKFASINSEDTNSSTLGYELTGKGEKNSVLTVYIYSDMPVVATVKTDEFGNWKYELGKSLIDGEHEVYVAVNDNTGKVVNKSQPLRFFINEAKAVSVSDFINSQNTSAPKESEKAISSYTYVAIFAIIIGIIVFVFAIIKRKKQVAV